MYIKGKQHEKCFGIYDDLVGLDGSYVPFNDIRNGWIQITPCFLDRIMMLKGVNRITLVPEDAFKIDRYGTITLVKGPSYFNNPFLREMSRTRLTRSLIILPGRAEAVKIYWPYAALAFQELPNGQVTEREFIPFPDRSQAMNISPVWDVVIVSQDRNHNRIQRVLVNPQATIKGAEWLKERFAKGNFLKEPSGIFDHCRDIIKSQIVVNQSHNDDEWLEWWEKNNTTAIV